MLKTKIADSTRPNLDPRTTRHAESGITPVVADACSLSLPTDMVTRRFHPVYSNSVLEHLGGHHRRKQFADTVHSHADHHWVQTPYRYFPVEHPTGCSQGCNGSRSQPASPSPGTGGHGHVPRAGRTQATRDVQEVELLSAAEMRSYFPASTIWFERFAGLPKSLVARK
ncbi:hypothetical protein AB0E64_18110 [Streptomyces caelestis]|jgi:hypothetical protein|uniref:Uncharacterized protein n=1 Tax=Streptomyces caelestis TaxID=36816 RepID=A0A7W9H4J8_9ACTN|nr:methyltransferase type 11 [Streptomyces caelestis]MBB5795589.1 hypothetical protein [Streptomyces caelestis]GGW61006.1 hypothetical protein GCM10010320_47660 [Streptomyces caelestis]